MLNDTRRGINRAVGSRHDDMRFAGRLRRDQERHVRQLVALGTDLAECKIGALDLLLQNVIAGIAAAHRINLVFSDLDRLHPFRIELIALRWDRLSNLISAVRKRIIIGRRIAVLVRDQIQAVDKLTRLVDDAVHLNRSLGHVFDGKVATGKRGRAQCRGLVQLTVRLGHRDAAANDVLVAAELLVDE